MIRVPVTTKGWNDVPIKEAIKELQKLPDDCLVSFMGDDAVLIVDRLREETPEELKAIADGVARRVQYEKDELCRLMRKYPEVRVTESIREEAMKEARGVSKTRTLWPIGQRWPKIEICTVTEAETVKVWDAARATDTVCQLIPGDFKIVVEGVGVQYMSALEWAEVSGKYEERSSAEKCHVNDT